MSFAKIVCMAVLIAMSAAAVEAGSIGSGGNDPAFTINKCSKSCDETDFGFAPGFLGLSQANPLVIDYTTLGTFNFKYTGTTTLNFPPGNLWLQIEMIPGPPFPVFNCVSSALFQCAGNTLGTVLDSLEFSFTGGPLVPNEVITVTVAPSINALATPEPSTMLLFLSLAPAIGFAKKRWNSRQAV